MTASVQEDNTMLACTYTSRTSVTCSNKVKHIQVHTGVYQLLEKCEEGVVKLDKLAAGEQAVLALGHS